MFHQFRPRAPYLMLFEDSKSSTYNLNGICALMCAYILPVHTQFQLIETLICSPDKYLFQFINKMGKLGIV